MYFSPYKVSNDTRSMQSSFAGLNKNARIGDSEFSDMLNMSSDHLPLLAPRKMRNVVQKQISETVTEEVVTPTEWDEAGNVTATTTETVTMDVSQRLNGILGDVGFCAVWGSDFYYMGKKVEGLKLIDGEKKLVAMGANILIYPDTVYYNTVNGKYGTLDKDLKTVSGTTRLRKVTINGTSRNPGDVFSVAVDYAEGTAAAKTSIKIFIGDYIECSKLPDSTSYWYAIASDTRVSLYKYKGDLYYPYDGTLNEGTNYTNAKLVNITTWKKLEFTQIQMLAAYVPDEITNSATNLWSGDKHLRSTYVDASTPYYKMDISGKIFDYVTGFNAISGGSNYIKATYNWRLRTLPILDYVCVHENRLWGCHYGTQVNTYESVNEIYCSALDDFKTWTLSSDTSMLAGDPYTASVGDYGPFTGCISHRGYVLFFKDDVIYRVSGTKPANFQITKISTCGVQEGCEKSMEIIDEVLYYKSKSGIYAYDGSLPQKISENLGGEYYTDAVAGSLLSKYYITMKQGGERKMYVYDTRYGVWHAEDDIDVRFFTEYDGALYGGVGNDIVCLAGEPAEIFTETESEGEFEWAAESGDIGLSSPYQKYYRRLLIRMDMEMGARVKVELATDGGEWLIVSDFTAPSKRSFLMPVVTPRCDHMRLRISGRGDAKIYSISYETETAGERP